MAGPLFDQGQQHELQVVGAEFAPARKAPAIVAHAVQHRLYPLAQLEGWPDESRQTRVVLIGQNMPVRQIRDLFAALAPRPRKAFGWGSRRDA